uniref:Putative DEAD/DEAH box helicase n=1 Tax=Callitropsis funebris TaxID=74301 RepID=A0A3S6KJL2_9CONI|nr:putative DEAD/DEAH box helicase [Callitropsis funebris]
MATVKTCISSYVFNTTTHTTTAFPKFCDCRWKSNTKVALTNPLLPASISSKFSKRRETRRSALYSSKTSTLVYETKEKKVVRDEDPIGSFNQQLRKEKWARNQPTERVNPKEAQIYMDNIKEKRKKGLKKLEQAKLEGKEKTLSYTIDPETLVEGDYVVHKKVGVGRFVGIKRSGDKKYVYIQYGDGMAKISVDQSRRLLYRYNLPNEIKKPRTLNKLGDTSTWEKRKSKGKLAIQKMVVDMMEKYMQRLKQKRPPYPKSPDYSEFAAKFPYTPTPDQLQAFSDVEADLTERETPMDRLICGDVGFGKTEVALRAIYLVALAGKQVMVLAPTIVLAKQHYEVICDRFSGYPDVKVGFLSRFQTKAEKAEVCARISEGYISIAVGTHALLGSQVNYSNVGLLVVDEEQRFGVKQKEKITSFKTSVDVLTLSATPIPRTLYLSLGGYRDASLIMTPPPERVPIITHLSEFDKEKVISAIKFELARGGQVFYVRPRIKGLDETKEFLLGAFRNVQIGIAHGKQAAYLLENTMKDFAEGEIKILLSTNIVESGLDIQNANTIIIEDVHLFGLAQMYQLRGRVGRADKEAYAYLFHPQKSRMSDDALDRLAALQECSGLGCGFRLAERDMAIRGFGSIFGEEQSGDIANVGIDLYTEMLSESLSKVGQYRLAPVPYEVVQLGFHINSRLPYEYIDALDDPRRIIEEAEGAAKEDLWTLMNFTEQLRRQYGKEPPSMELFLKKIYVKRMAADLGITEIAKSAKAIVMRTSMTREAFKFLLEAMPTDHLRSSLKFEGGHIKAHHFVDIANERLLEWLFECLADMHTGLPAFVKY